MNPVKQFHSGLQNGGRGQGRGRGRGINRQTSGVSPLNRSHIDQVITEMFIVFTYFVIVRIFSCIVKAVELSGLENIDNIMDR